MSENDEDHTPNPTIAGPVPELPDVDVNYEPVKDLGYTRKIRGMIVRGIASDGIPKDPKMLTVMLSTMKDMDSAALGQMRIKSEEAGQNLQAQQQALVREYLAQTSGAKPPMREAAGDREVEIPTLKDDIATRDFVPGELTQGTINNTFEKFVEVRGDVKLAEVDAPD